MFAVAGGRSARAAAAAGQVQPAHPDALRPVAPARGLRRGISLSLYLSLSMYMYIYIYI